MGLRLGLLKSNDPSEAKSNVAGVYLI